MRVFRLDAIQPATLRDDRFHHPAEFDPLADVLRTLAEQAGAWLVWAVWETIEQAEQLLPARMATLPRATLSSGVFLPDDCSVPIPMTR